tara:strand:- start:422 stop:895 length:474 start_codon:yes stop_codon:yes gene_type:complete
MTNLSFKTLESADIITVKDAPRVTTSCITVDHEQLKDYFPPTQWEQDNDLVYWVVPFLTGSPCSSLDYILNTSIPNTLKKIRARLNDPSATLQQQESEAEKMTVVELRRGQLEEMFLIASEQYAKVNGENWTPNSRGNLPSKVIGFDPSVLEKLKVA